MTEQTVKLTFEEWTNLVTLAVTEIGQDTAIGIMRAALGEERANRLIIDRKGERLSKQDNHAIIRGLYPHIPGEDRAAKIEWIIQKAGACFATPERFAEIVAYAKDRVGAFEAEGGTLDKYPEPAKPAGTLTGAESGFLWKPIGENSNKLRVLLPSSFTGKVDRDSVELWRAGAKVERLAVLPVANGNREHYAGAKPGGAYNAGTQVRATAEGTVWIWTVGNPAARTENVKATKQAETAPSAPAAPSNPRYSPGLVEVPAEFLSGTLTELRYGRSSLANGQVRATSNPAIFTIPGPDDPAWAWNANGAAFGCRATVGGRKYDGYVNVRTLTASMPLQEVGKTKGKAFWVMTAGA